MMMNYRSLRIGCAKKRAKIVELEIRKPKNSKKLYLKTQTDDGKMYTINEVWTKDRNENITTKGLWLDLDVDNQICSDSTLGRFLAFMGVSAIGDLVGKEITISPKTNGFMSIITNN